MLTNNNVYRLLAIQIVPFWEAIKFSCTKADGIREEDRADYFNELLQALLSDKAQCFVVLGKNRVLHSLAITRVLHDKVPRRKVLYIQSLYSVTVMDDVALQKYFGFIVQFARRENCTAITLHAINYRIYEIASKLGCVERYRHYDLEIGGN